MLQWEIITPLGIPVDPLVYMITAISEATGLACCLFPAVWVKKENVYCVETVRSDPLVYFSSHSNITLHNCCHYILLSVKKIVAKLKFLHKE